MASVAIIHAAEDALPARALAEKLRQAKLTVVLEKPPGEEQRNAAKDAKVTIALWSPRSVGQAPLVEDAAFARGKSKIIHAAMQNAATPAAFSSDKTVNLTGWRGEDDFPAWRELAKLVTDKAGVAPLPPAPPKAASSFFQPGLVNPAAVEAAMARGPSGGARSTPQSAPRRPAEQQRAAAPQNTSARPASAPRPAPAQRAALPSEPSSGGGGRGMMIGIIAFVVIAVVGGGGYFFWSQSQSAQSTSATWESVAQNDADALRAFISGDPGEFRDEAETALAALEERSFESASDTDTIDAFEGFLNDFPDSQHAIAARGRIAELQTLTPATAPEEGVLPPTEDATDPDLLPPGTTAPDSGAGPAALTPPVEEPLAPPPADAPTN